MMPPVLTPQEETEISLIQSDATELARALLATRQHPDAGIFPYATTGLLGLVTEESFHYLTNKSPTSALYLPKPELFSKFASNIMKARARLKLFDDTDGHEAGLIDGLAAAHARSREWFDAPYRGFFRSWIRHLQPDLGMYFVGEKLAATTHTALFSLGITLVELKALTPSDLDGLGQRQLAFGYEVGVYLRRLSNLFEKFGKPIELHPSQVTADALRLTHNDFVGAKVYRAARDAFGLSEDRSIGALLMAQSQINCAIHVLPAIITPGSNLLFRMQFLTAYHARNMLRAAAPQLLSERLLTGSEAAILGSRKLRNSCAHYGLRGAGVAAVGTDDPFSELIQSQTQMTRVEAAALLGRWLSNASDALQKRVSKSGLRRVRALFGDHS